MSHTKKELDKAEKEGKLVLTRCTFCNKYKRRSDTVCAQPGCINGAKSRPGYVRMSFTHENVHLIYLWVMEEE